MAVISSIQIDTSSAKKSIAELEKELQEVNDQLKEVEIGSDAFYELQKKAATAKGQIDNINRTTDALSKGFQGFGENLAKVSSGITGGITAATAAMQLMGIENENVVAGIAKLQQLMALTQGISALKDLIEGFKVLRTTITTLIGSSGPLGLAVLALSAIAAAWVAIKNRSEEATVAADDYKTKIEDIDDLIRKEKQEKILSNLPSDVAANYRKAILDMEKYEKAYQKVVDTLWTTRMSAEKRAELANIAKEYKALAENAKQYISDVLMAYPNYVAGEVAAKADEAKRKANELQQVIQETDKFLNSWRNDTDKDTAVSKPELPDDEEDTTEALAKNEKLKDLFKQYSFLKEKLGETDTWTTYMNSLRTQKQDEMTLLQEMRNNNLVSEEEYRKRLFEINEYYNRKAKALEEELIRIKADAAAQSLISLSSVFSSIASAMDESDEKQRKAMVAFQAASIVTSTISGAIMAYTGAAGNSGLNAIPIVGPAVAQATGITNMLAVIASGAAQLANLRSKGNSDNANLSGVSSAATSAIITPPTQYSQAVEGAKTEAAITDTRVYVVESDIQQAGSRVNVQESENRY